MLVYYSNDNEVLVCEKKNEKKLLKTYFGKTNFARNLDEYDRGEASEIVEIKPRLITGGGRI